MREESPNPGQGAALLTERLKAASGPLRGRKAPRSAARDWWSAVKDTLLEEILAPRERASPCSELGSAAKECILQASRESNCGLLQAKLAMQDIISVGEQALPALPQLLKSRRVCSRGDECSSSLLAEKIRLRRQCRLSRAWAHNLQNELKSARKSLFLRHFKSLEMPNEVVIAELRARAFPRVEKVASDAAQKNAMERVSAALIASALGKERKMSESGLSHLTEGRWIDDAIVNAWRKALEQRATERWKTSRLHSITGFATAP